MYFAVFNNYKSLFYSQRVKVPARGMSGGRREGREEWSFDWGPSASFGAGYFPVTNLKRNSPTEHKFHYTAECLGSETGKIVNKYLVLGTELVR